MRSILTVMLTGGLCLPPAAAMATSADDPHPLVEVATIPDDLRLDPSSVPGGEEALKCLALNDYWEARGETKAGRVAVAKVVLNRVRDARYPADICDVVTENKTGHPRACQFSWHCDGRSDKPEEEAAWRQSLLLAAAVLYSGEAIEDPSEGALWYHALSVTPDWSETLEVALTLGNHIFYRDPAGPRLDPTGVKMLASFRAAGPGLPPDGPVEEGEAAAVRPAVAQAPQIASAIP